MNMYSAIRYSLVSLNFRNIFMEIIKKAALWQVTFQSERPEHEKVIPRQFIPLSGYIKS